MNIITTNPAFKRIQSWQGAALPSGYAIVPDTMDTSDFYAYNGCVDLAVTDNTVTAIAPNVTAWQAWKATLPDDTAITARQVRRDRDQKLTDCDWTQMADCPLDVATKTAWQTYRQALRDVPNQSGFPNDVTWPVAPE